jgi:hypothetical protein
METRNSRHTTLAKKAVAEFRLCVGHGCLGTHLHCIGVRPNSFCMLCKLREPMGRNHLGQRVAMAVSDTGRPGQKWWKTDCTPSLLVLLLLWLLIIIRIPRYTYIPRISNGFTGRTSQRLTINVPAIRGKIIINIWNTNDTNRSNTTKTFNKHRIYGVHRNTT